MTTYLLIDLGYFSFYRLHACKSWYKKAKDYINDEEMYNDEIFQNTLIKRIKTSINEIIKKNKLNISNIIFCKDCNRSNIWRTEIYPEYKQTRKNLKCGNSFNIIHETIKEISNTNNIPIIYNECCEADDIVYIVKKYLSKLDPNNKFIILASDIDYYQLINDNTKMLRLDNRNPYKTSTGDPKKDLLIKIICGDKSDNIPSIKKKCGIKTAIKLIDEPEILSKLLIDEKINRQYNLNTKLVDLNYIPIEIQKTVQDELNILKFETI